MKRAIAFILASCLSTPSFAASPNDPPVINWGSSQMCNLREYIDFFNAQHPETQLFLEDVAHAVAQESAPSELAKIDRDGASTIMAAQVARCLVDPYYLLPSRMESTLKEAYALYFSDRSSRRALWLFFQQLDAQFLRSDQRADARRKREDYWINFADGALYGTVALSLAIWAIRRGRIPAPMPSMTGPARSAVTNGLHDTDLYTRMARLLRFKERAANVGKFAVVTGATGGAVGSALYYARKNGFISERDEKSVDEMERTYHRLHWLELDCRARQFRASLKDRKYADSKDPRLARDSKVANGLINDLNFLVDVSPLYYTEVEFPPDMVHNQNSVSYRGTTVQCAPGFSRPDPGLVTVKDVHKAVSEAGADFLKLYADFLSEPLKAKAAAFLKKTKPSWLEALKRASPVVNGFFVETAVEIPDKLGASNVILNELASYLGIRARLTGRPEFLQEFGKFLDSLDKSSLAEMSALQREAIGVLPPALFNQVVLDLLADRALTPTNMIYTLQMGLTLRQAVEAKIIPDLKPYIQPDEFLFSAHGPFAAPAPKEPASGGGRK